MTTKAAFWLKLKPGSVVTLKDEKSLLTNMNGVETMVKRILKLPECEGRCTWLLMELEESSDKATRWLMVKIVGGDVELDFRIYHLPVKFERGNRHDLISSGDCEGHWIFQPPEPEEQDDYGVGDERDGEPPGIDLLALVYTNEFAWDEVTYRKKAQGDFNCGDFDGGHPVVETPKPDGISYHEIATLAEYIADDEKAEQSEALVFEIGDADDNGGLLSLMIGYPLVVTDLDILAK